jgi:hypothetical protein
MRKGLPVNHPGIWRTFVIPESLTKRALIIVAILCFARTGQRELVSQPTGSGQRVFTLSGDYQGTHDPSVIRKAAYR